MEEPVRLVLRCSLVTLLVFAAQGTVVMAQALTPETVKEAQAFTLDADIAGKILAVREQLDAQDAARGLSQQELARRAKLTLEERVAELEADKAAAGILGDAGLAPRTYLVGLLALRGSAMASRGMTVGVATAASPANVEFLKSNPEIAQRVDKAAAGGSMLSAPKKR
jgi:hypothetical protein